MNVDVAINATVRCVGCGCDFEVSTGYIWDGRCPYCGHDHTKFNQLAAERDALRKRVAELERSGYAVVDHAAANAALRDYVKALEAKLAQARAVLEKNRRRMGCAITHALAAALEDRCADCGALIESTEYMGHLDGCKAALADGHERDRMPPPPERLVDALQDRVHVDTGISRPGRSVKAPKAALED